MVNLNHEPLTSTYKIRLVLLKWRLITVDSKVPKPHALAHDIDAFCAQCVTVNILPTALKCQR